MTRPPLSFRAALFAIFVSALIVRAGFCFVAIPALGLNLGPARSDFYTSTDGYLDIAINLADHGRYAFTPDAPPTTYRAPAYPVALALAYASLGEPAHAVLAVNCVASALTCVVVFIIARRLFGERVTSAWSLPIVLFPLSIYYCASSFSDTALALAIALYLWTLIALFQSPSTSHGVFAGVAFAVAALTKAVVLPLAVLFVVFAALRHRRALPASIVAAVVGFALVGGWTYRNYHASGDFVPVTGGAGFNALLGNFMIDHGGDCDASLKAARRDAVAHLQDRHGITIDLSALDTDGHLDVPREIDRQYGRAALAMYRDDPMLVARKLAINGARFWYFSSSPTKSLVNGVINGVVLLLAIAGLVAVRRRERVAADLLAVFVVAYVLLYAVVIVHSSRFCLPIVMPLLPLATAPVMSVVHAMRSRDAESMAFGSSPAIRGAKP